MQHSYLFNIFRLWTSRGQPFRAGVNYPKFSTTTTPTCSPFDKSASSLAHNAAVHAAPVESESSALVSLFSIYGTFYKLSSDYISRSYFWNSPDQHAGGGCYSRRENFGCSLFANMFSIYSPYVRHISPPRMLSIYLSGCRHRAYKKQWNNFSDDPSARGLRLPRYL